MKWSIIFFKLSQPAFQKFLKIQSTRKCGSSGAWGIPQQAKFAFVAQMSCLPVCFIKIIWCRSAYKFVLLGPSSWRRKIVILWDMLDISRLCCPWCSHLRSMAQIPRKILIPAQFGLLTVFKKRIVPHLLHAGQSFFSLSTLFSTGLLPESPFSACLFWLPPNEQRRLFDLRILWEARPRNF